MKTRVIGIIMNGVTGRMGTHQHLVRSILALREQGGLKIGDGEVLIPEPLLLGRNEEKLRKLSEAHGGLPYSTDFGAALKDERYPIYFDAQTTVLRFESVKRAIAAGKHIYCEKPSATTSSEAMELYRKAEKAGVKHGVVQDKLWLPGLRKLKYLIDTGFFGTIFSVRGEFGYWVFTGERVPAQRPSWNYRKEDGGGIILDMLPHWRYVIDNLFGNVVAVSCLGARNIGQRWDEQQRPYTATAEDAAYATFFTDKDIICHFNSSWETRVRRDDLLTLHVDGRNGSAVAGLRQCWVQADAMTPKPVWNPDEDNPLDFYGTWSLMPGNQIYDNAFKAQWELFLRHVALPEKSKTSLRGDNRERLALYAGDPFPWNLEAGARGVQLAELGYQSWQKRAWVDVPPLV